MQRRFSRLLPLQLVKTAYLDPSRNYLAGFHPHGILATGAFTNLCTESTGFSSLFPGIRPHLMMLNLWFWIPFFTDYIMSGGEFSQPWVTQLGEGCRHGGGILQRAVNSSIRLPSECVVEKEARFKEALPTALCSVIHSVGGWEDLKGSVPVLRELMIGNWSGAQPTSLPTVPVPSPYT